MTDTIVVGVDGSETAMKAARAAARLATGMGGELRVVTAYEGDRTEVVEIGSDRWVVSDADDAERVAQLVASDLGSTGVKTTFAALRGKPHEVLISEADRLGAKVIVVGSVRMQGMGRILGSVANTVAHNASCDVYIVKTD
ncbi:universal stress protein [Paeniglutamicibacter antarcticus]|uniref:Universal stress protein n=1 Tax=Arthrobacter terrae TaxID=2935737 RepID=A0A931CSS1_9MICC|nr:universal stress protein [Arthrobacter terrae]MBG0740779.1 universal stress protein [Arthrobacter terrae]